MWKTFKIFCKNGKFHVAEHHRLPNHTIDWDSAQCLLPTTPTTFNAWLWKSGLLIWNRLPSTGVNHYRHHTNDSSMTLRLQTNRTFLTDRDWPITTDLRHLSLTANNIAAEPTNQFTQTGLRTFDWQQLFLGSKDDFCSGCRNVSHRHQSSSGLHSPGRSDYTITRNPLLVTHGS